MLIATMVFRRRLRVLTRGIAHTGARRTTRLVWRMEHEREARCCPTSCLAGKLLLDGEGVYAALMGKQNPLVSTTKRAFWLLMLVAHAPAGLGAWRSVIAGGLEPERLGCCIVLTLSMVFFALKLRDVAFLRLRTDRRALVVFCIVVALLHVNVIRPHSDATVAPQCVALVATTWLLAGLPSTRRVLKVARVHLAQTRKHCLPNSPFADSVRLDLFSPHCWVLAFRLFCLRAPPA